MKRFFIISFTIHILIFILAAYIFVPTAKYKTILNDSPIDVEIQKSVNKRSSFREIIRKQKDDYESKLSRKLPKLQANSLINIAYNYGYIKEVVGKLNIPPKAKIPETSSLIPMPAFPLPASLFDIYEPIFEYKIKIMKREASRPMLLRNVISQNIKPSAKGMSPESELPAESLTSKTPKGFSDIFPDLAQCISERTYSNIKINIVFVIDITADMETNVNEVRNNIDIFIAELKEQSIDATLSLIEFTDEQIRKPTVIGSAKDLYEFKKWLYRIKFLSGGDLPESGYEALMVALKKVRLKEPIQRSLILISNASQHDINIDDKSVYCLNDVIDKLNAEKVYLDVIGPDYLPMKQLAWRTNGKWWKIPHGFPIK